MAGHRGHRACPNRPPLAVDEVNHAGEPVAVVVARSQAAAVDALDAIDVDYEPLPVVLDMEAAIADGSPLVHSDKGTNKSYTWIFDSAAAGTGGSPTMRSRTPRSSSSGATGSSG